MQPKQFNLALCDLRMYKEHRRQCGAFLRPTPGVKTAQGMRNGICARCSKTPSQRRGFVYLAIRHDMTPAIAMRINLLQPEMDISLMVAIQTLH